MMLRVDDNGTHRIDGKVEATRDLAARALDTPRPRHLGIKIGGKPRTVCAECLDLSTERIAAGLAPPLQRSLERIERRGKTPAGSVNCARLSHRPPSSRRPKLCIGKRFFYVKIAFQFGQ